MVAPRILWRYILRDVLIYTCLGLLVFSMLLVVQNTLRFIEELLSAGVGLGGLMKLVGVILPSYLCYAIPTSLLMGVLLAFGRMSADGEIIAMRTSGISVPRLLPPVFALSTLAALLTGYLLFELEPRSHQRMKMLVREMASSSQVASLGDFREFGDRTVYVDAAGDETCPLKGVLIGDFSDPRRTFYIAARCGSIGEGTETTSLALDLVDGSIHFSESASDRYRKIHFVKMHTEIDLADYLDKGLRARDLTFRQLLRYDAEFRRGETPVLRDAGGHRSVKVQIHRRVAFPFAAVLLTFLSVPLGIRPVRAGRSAGALTAIVLMALYWLVFTAGELMGERGWVPPWLGVWTANLLALGVALFLMRLALRGDS
jgi:lipopolysaccharide export system permease protein